MKLNEKSRGLGDTIEKFTTATGIKNVVTKVTKAVGAEVIATASNDDKLKVAKEYGANYCINYSRPWVWAPSPRWLG